MRCTTNLNEKVCSLESDLLVFQAVEPTELVLLMVSTHSCKKVDVDQLLGSNRLEQSYVKYQQKNASLSMTIL